MLVLDTDAVSLIQYVGASPRYKALVKMLDDADDDVYVTVISLDEQLHGAFNEIANKDRKACIRGYRRLRSLIGDYARRPMLDYDETADAVFDRLKGIKGRPATKDLRIACIVLAHDATLVTGNVADFANVPLLKIQPIPGRSE